MYSSRLSHQKTSSRKTRKSSSSRSKSKPATRRKNPRLLNNLLSQGGSFREEYFENASPEEIIKIFEESYCSSIVNFLLDLKKSTAKRIFELIIRHKKRAFLNVITLYYYKDYLINPLPLTLEAVDGQEMPNHYAILGVPREVSHDDLKIAYKLLSSSFSADSFPPAERKASEERLREIDASFEILKNQKRRKDLDNNLPNINYLYPRRDQCWLESVNRLVS